MCFSVLITELSWNLAWFKMMCSICLNLEWLWGMLSLHQRVPVARGATYKLSPNMHSHGYTGEPMNNPNFFIVEQTCIHFTWFTWAQCVKCDLPFSHDSAETQLPGQINLLIFLLLSCPWNQSLHSKEFGMFSLGFQAEVVMKMLISGWCVHVARCTCSLRWCWLLKTA